MSNFALRRTVNERLSATLLLVDPLSLDRSETETRDYAHVQRTESRMANRALRLTLAYAFGKMPQSTRRPIEHTQQEMPVVR